MKLYLAMTNKLYNKIHQLPLQNSSKQLKFLNHEVYGQFDICYQFFYKGKQLLAKQVNELIELNHQIQQWIIVNKKHKKQEPNKKVSYESHRQVIKKYIKQTKTNQKQKIKQNAEFIFENAIDGNFKYHTFEYFQLEKQFTEERKAELLNEVFWRMCENKNDEVNLAERKKKNQQKAIKDKKQQKDQVNKQQSKKSNINSVSLNKKIFPLKQENQQDSQNEPQKMQQKQSQDVLELHELEYINQNWKQLLCINKYLLKTNLDNLDYYAELPRPFINADKRQQEQDEIEKMQRDNNEEKVQNKPYDEEIEI